MDALQTPSSSQGTETVDSSASASVPCLLNDLPKDAHQYIHAIEERLRTVENVLRENGERTKAMGMIIFKNPAAKMFLATLPKETQNRLKEMFGESNGNGNS